MTKADKVDKNLQSWIGWQKFTRLTKGSWQGRQELNWSTEVDKGW